MNNSDIFKKAREDAEVFSAGVKDMLEVPAYNPTTYFKDLTTSDYFDALIILRHHLKMASDYYFAHKNNAFNVDLFMMTPSVSSPMGKGSDSEAVPIKFGNLDTYLVDSSQFGFEPLLFNYHKMLYCFLPSMRGEDPDKRHLNQFFHCEMEMKGTMEEMIPVIEGYVKTLIQIVKSMESISSKISKEWEKAEEIFNEILNKKQFERIEYFDAKDLLKKDGYLEGIEVIDDVEIITGKGELRIAELKHWNTPFWIVNFDRDSTPFYQKPHQDDENKVICGDLIFPNISEHSFGGEIVGCGQRQDNKEEIAESLRRQNVNPEAYDWYIELRDLNGYQTTSGFGLGFERFITWALSLDDIKDTILYPRLKNVQTRP